ncbi:hypothetical protein SAV14893_065570 [Streptomyces avermitilis]|uniref:Uncharacterized protein n=1 Tax=Streptomyces avermitilis TaxID=33903 RepID=A0A4D4M5R3_STRAX|nr:hypothetical protein SAV14893_065570 [Streptomyces avermitilis]
MRAVGDDPVQPCVRAAPLLARLPHDRDQPGGGEAFDEVGHGRPGQSGELLQLPRRQGPSCCSRRSASRSLMALAVLGDAGMPGSFQIRRRHSGLAPASSIYQAGFLIVYGDSGEDVREGQRHHG